MGNFGDIAMRKEIERIVCEDDEGNLYTVIIRQKMHSYDPIKGPRQEYGGSKDAILSDGRHVNFIDREQNTFQILDNSKFIRRVVRR